MKINYKLFSITIVCVVAGCQHPSTNNKNGRSAKSVGMPNPASVYCAQLHGTSTKVSEPKGEYAICNLPSGERMEEWALFYRDHPTK